VSRRNLLTPAQGLDDRILTMLCVPFKLDIHARRVRSCHSFGVSTRPSWFARLVSTPRGDIHVPPAEVSTHHGGGFALDEPRLCFFKLSLHSEKRKLRQFILELILLLG